MEKRNLLAIILVVLAILLIGFASWQTLTGKAVVGKRNYKCTDSDGGEFPSIYGITKDDLSKTYYDTCFSYAKRLKEYYCYDNMVRSRTYYCAGGCTEGICKN